MNDATAKDYARQIADSIIETARTSGPDPIAWVTGNRYMPPLRSFALAEAVWQSDDNADGEAFQYLHELVEQYVDDAHVALVWALQDNALYAIDLDRFEYAESDDGETLQDDWQPVTH